MTATHYRVQTRVFLDSVGDEVFEGVNRRYSLKVWGDTPPYFETSDPDDPIKTIPYDLECGIAGINTSESLNGHSAGISFMMGPIGAMLRDRLECQDCLRIEANTGAGWEVLFDGFVSSISWSKTSSPQGYSYRLQIHAEGLHRIFQQGWLNWRQATQAGMSDYLTAGGRSILDKLATNPILMKPQYFMGMLMDYGVSDLMGLTGRDGVEIKRGSYWQFGNFSDPDKDVDAPLWNNAMGLQLTAAVNTYLDAQGPLWGTIAACSEPELHEFFITYAPRGGVEGADKIPTVVFRPIPFPGPADDPVSSEAQLKFGLPAGVSYPDENEWLALPCLRLGSENDAPAPLSISASKNDSGRKNMFVWSMSSGMDGSQDMLLSKGTIGLWLDDTSRNRYGFSSCQVTTAVYDRKTPAEWQGKQIPRVLARVAYQKAALPYLWNHQRTYPLLPGARAGTVLQDSTDMACGYIVSVSHQIQAGSTGAFHAATTIQAERVIEGAIQDDYPAYVRKYLTKMKNIVWKGSTVADQTREAVYGKPTPAGGFKRIKPIAGALVPRTGEGLNAPRRGGLHNAVDFAVPAGTDLVAPCDGRFIIGREQVGKDGASCGAGKYVKFIGDDGTTHILGHLNVLPVGLKNGAVIKAGVTPLGKTGNTGTVGGTTGNHLHWQILSRDRIYLDPLKWIAGEGVEE